MMIKQLTQITRKRLVDHVIEQLLLLISQGQLKEGERLPTENQLAQQLGVGRGTVREAIGALSLTGVVEARPKTGTRLLISASELRTKPLKFNMGARPAKIGELIDARILIEQAIVELAAKNAIKSDLAEMRNELNAIARTQYSDQDKRSQHDISFHFALAQASHNSILLRFLSEMRPLMRHWITQTQDSVTLDDLAASLKDHEDILNAIENNDVEKAKAAITKHLRESAQKLDRSLLRKSIMGNG